MNARERRLNRIVSSMPYHKLSVQIQCKAMWEGVPVIKLSERDTSKICYRCGSKNTSRLTQSVFEGHACGLVYNADLNWATNIAKRFREQGLRDGAAGSLPITLPEVNLRVNDEERSYASHQTKR